MENKEYYLGLDIGTDSVGYAVTDPDYNLLKFRGEPMWGTTTFEAAALAEERRVNRTARRRLDRRQQRVQLVNEIFAQDICAIDPNFFIRRQESALFSEDTRYGVKLFNDPALEKQYHRDYPTIHHLIADLMQSEEPRDVRFVYLACAWLVANRGHFLSDAAVENVGDFSAPYAAFCEYLQQDCGCSLPWPDSVGAETIQRIMQASVGVTRKKAMFAQELYGGKKLPTKPDEEYPFRQDVLITLLSGGKAAPKDLFDNPEYAELDSVALSMDEENFDRILSELGDDGALLRTLRAMYDCALLNITLKGKASISEAKVAVYNQHAQDLKWLKYFIRRYHPKDYSRVFRRAEKGNYAAYSGNWKNCPDTVEVKRAKKEDFSEFLAKLVKNTPVAPEDDARYTDMQDRLSACTFLPRQKDTDNRVIPHQLYEYELCRILQQAGGYLPLLTRKDGDGFTAEEKLLSVFRFRIPYYVGPLNTDSPAAWVKREPGKIYPWNFDAMVDHDESERRFISRMTNTCTYLPGEEVLPCCSLLYSRFMVLNELNNLKINSVSIPVSVKQELYTQIFEQKSQKVSLKTIVNYLKSHGYMESTDEISGMDFAVKATLKSQHSFARLLSSGTLTEEQVEEIIRHAAYSEDKNRMAAWLRAHYPMLSEQDCRYILHLNLKEFGRLSRKLLTGIYGCRSDGSGEAMTIMDALWQTNDNLMQLLSDRYTFREQIAAFTAEYYANPTNRQSLSDRLSDMYVSNAVKRPIIRTLDIVTDVVKAMHCPPAKIFVEMARGGTADQRGKRTQTRRQQLLELYSQVKAQEVPALRAELEAMGDTADNRLQSDRLFLYYLQLGRCMYTGQPIELTQLASRQYDIDHIYPQSRVQDDSLLNNKVLCLSSANGAKGDRYPIDPGIRSAMAGYWTFLKEKGLITEEKHRRLMRPTAFTEEELRQFINRQLVETRQSTKAVAQLLKEKYPDAGIVYVKAGMVSDFRHEFDLLKCRSVNDLHHAKDAYLNVVVGNVYHEKFTKRFFDVRSDYTLNIRPLFTHPVCVGSRTVWNGEAHLSAVKKTMGKNAVHLTRYAFCRKGGLFDQMPLKADAGLIPRKAGLPTEKYGGYNKPAASFYLLVSYDIGKKHDAMFAPVELRYAARVQSDADFAREYITGVVSEINGNKPVTNLQLALKGRPIKINTLLTLDGMPVNIRGKCNKGANIIVGSQFSLILGAQMERYVKRLERYTEKKRTNALLQLDAQQDGITQQGNMELYTLLARKMSDTLYAKCPGNFVDTLEKGEKAFAVLTPEEQVKCLMNILSWFANAPGCDLTAVGGKAKSGAKVPSSKLSALAKNYSDIRIVDASASGLFVSRSENLLELL